MIKYVRANSQLVKIDTDNFDNIEVIDYSSHAIDWIWIVPEEGIVEDKEVKKGDIIIRLYGNYNTDARTVVIPKGEFTEHLIKYNTPREKECLDDCDNCETRISNETV